MAEVSTAQGNSLVGQDAPTNSSWTSGDGNMLDDATETDTLTFLAPVQHSDRDDFLINIHVEEAGSASPLDALKRSKSGARSGRSSPMRGRSVSPLRERLIAKALTANSESTAPPPPPPPVVDDGMSHWRGDTESKKPPANAAVARPLRDGAGLPTGGLNAGSLSAALERVGMEDEEEEEEEEELEFGGLPASPGSGTPNGADSPTGPGKKIPSS